MNFGNLHMYQAPMVYFHGTSEPTPEAIAKLAADLRAEGQDELANMLETDAAA